MSILITKHEIYDVDMLQKLLQKDGISRQDKAHLKAYHKRRINGNQVLVDYGFPKHYATIQKGRLYPQPRIGIEAFPRDIRAALFQKYYWDIDMENAQPVLLVHLAKRLRMACPALEEYCERRVEVLGEIMRDHNLNRDEAKTLCISVIFGGYRDQHPLLPRMFAELKNLAVLVSNENPDLFAVSCKDKDMKEKQNPQGSCLAVYIQNEERLILQHLDSFFTSKGRSLDGLIHDGGCLRKLENESMVDSHLLREAEGYVFEKTSYNVRLAVKPMVHTFQFEQDAKIYPLNAVIDDLFACRKLVEKNPDTFLRDGCELFMTNPETGLWQPYNLEDAKSVVFQMNEALVFKQESALGLRTLNYGGNVKNVAAMLSCLPQCVPTGQVPIEFRGSLGEAPDLHAAESRRIVALYSELLSLISNHNNEKLDYLVKYLAHAVQKPREIPGVCLVVTGSQGCGKDTTFNIFMEYVLGSIYSTNYDRNEHFFNPYDSSKGRKVMLKLEEANATYCSENSHSLKSLITNKKIKINPKHKIEYEVDNFARCIFTTNEGNPVNLEGDDRRYVLYDCSLEKSKDRAFWKDVHTTLFTETAGRILYHYFKSLDIQSFDVMTFPVSEYQQEVQQTWRSIEDLFIEDWDGEEANVESLFNKYRQFCIRLKMKEDSICNRMTFSKRLAAFSRDGKIKRRIKDGCSLYSKPEADPLIE